MLNGLSELTERKCVHMLEGLKLREAAERFADEVWEDLIEDIAYLVEVESVEDLEKATEEAPFGPKPAEALARSLEIADRLGLETHDCEHKIGYGEIKGASDTYLATICHCDIVPLGKDWATDPLKLTRRDGYILGRGVIDDKGPLVVSLYAANFFKRYVDETGEVLPYTLRSLIGANEETNMFDVDHYLKNYEAPAFCFSPDAMFPLICGEKGLCGITVSTKPIKASDSAFVEYWAGEAFNAIPSESYVVVRYNVQDLPEAANIEFRKAGMDDEGRLLSMIIAHGVGGHAAFPAGTVSAIDILANYLLDNHIVEGPEADFLRFQAELTSDWKGAALGVDCTDDIFGDLTIIGGTVRSVFEGDMVRFEQTMDSRYPMATTADEIADKIGAFAARYGLVVRETHAKKPFYIEPESPEIEACLSSYQEVYGRTDMPVTIGGGTYARRFPRAVAFGPLDEELETPDWVGPEHGANEGANEEMLKKSLVIYILALARLMRLDF